MRDLHIKVPDKLHKDFKDQCKTDERNMSAVIQELMRTYIEKAKDAENN